MFCCQNGCCNLQRNKEKTAASHESSRCCELLEREELGAFRHRIHPDNEIASVRTQTVYLIERWFYRSEARMSPVLTV